MRRHQRFGALKRAGKSSFGHLLRWRLLRPLLQFRSFALDIIELHLRLQEVFWRSHQAEYRRTHHSAQGVINVPSVLTAEMALAEV